MATETLEKPAQKEPPIKWVTGEEAEQLNKILLKDFNRRKEQNPGDTKKFIYRPVSLRPYVPAYHDGKQLTTATRQNLVMVTVNKFYRDRTIKAKRRVQGREIEEDVNEPVVWSKYDEDMMVWETVDPDANFDIDSRKFQELFVRDTTE